MRYMVTPSGDLCQESPADIRDRAGGGQALECLQYSKEWLGGERRGSQRLGQHRDSDGLLEGPTEYQGRPLACTEQENNIMGP